MVKVLLVSNEVFHYREKIYNYFFERFKDDGFEFHVAADKFQDRYQHTFFEHRMVSLKDWSDVVVEVKPDVVITFLHLKDAIFLPLIGYCKRRKIKIIYWGTGISWTDPDNVLKKLYYKVIHDLCDALITYSPDAMRFFDSKSQSKLFVAPNTLNLEGVSRTAYDRCYTKAKYGITQQHVALMVTRMTKYRKPHLLVEALANEDDIAVVLVGSGAEEELIDLVSRTDNAYYLGPKYGDEAYELFNAADVYSSPYTIGLGLNEAFFWGLPVVLINGGFHGAETYYLKDSSTGFVAKNFDDYQDKLKLILRDDELRETMSNSCLDTYENEMSVSRMYEGFLKAIEYVRSIDRGIPSKRVGRSLKTMTEQEK